MIQTILLFTLRPGVTDEQVEALRAALAAIPSEGRRHPEHARVRADVLAPPYRAPGTLPDPDLSQATVVSRRLVG